MNKIIYKPWSEDVLRTCLSDYKAGRLSTLDLELTARCSKAMCIYCDSSPKVSKRVGAELSLAQTLDMLNQSQRMGLRWVYCCGLGEPLEDQRFRIFVEACTRAGINISIFTNTLNIDFNTAAWLHENQVHLIVKLDSLNETHFDKILGRKGAANKIYRAIEYLLSAGYGRDCGEGLTDIAFSIVPTHINLHDIAKVVEYAEKVNAFPSVGELEQAGRVGQKNVYASLSLSQKEIDGLKKNMDMLLWKGYTRPICPSTVTGLHIDNQGDCIVDRLTGLNCKWFMLQEPDTHTLGNVYKNSIEDLLQLVRDYRKKCFQDNKNAISECMNTHFAFGGCGGSPCEIIKIAQSHLN